MQRLGASKIVQIDFIPKELVSYSKETQTPITSDQAEGKELFLFLRYNMDGYPYKLN